MSQHAASSQKFRQPRKPGLLQQVLNPVDVGGVAAEQIPAKQVAQALTLFAHRLPRRVALDPVIGHELRQREAVVCLRITRNPRRPEGLTERDGDVIEFDGCDAHDRDVRAQAAVSGISGVSIFEIAVSMSC